MILIDENIPEDERLALHRWKPLQIRFDFWVKGVSDDQIALPLRTLRQVTFCTHDRDFYAKRRQLSHPSFTVVLVDAPDHRFAVLVDRFLRHRSFRTHASRMGRVFKINENTIVSWRVADGLRTELNLVTPAAIH